MKECAFCRMPPERVVARDGPCYAVYDAYPVSKGHVLIIPARHVESFRDMTADEWLAVHRLASRFTGSLRQEDPGIEGFNLGINDGTAAGQTVMHTHIHLIPRRKGDVPNPRGGVRGVIPCRQDYPRVSPASCGPQGSQ